jgi:hypothetical protein
VETEEVTVDKKSKAAPPIVAVHNAESGPIHCRLYALKDEPYWTFDLESDNDTSTEEQYAGVLFGKEFESLNDEQKTQIADVLEAVPE